MPHSEAGSAAPSRRDIAVHAAAAAVILASAVSLYLAFLPVAPALWYAASHDRNGHYARSQSVAFALRQADLPGLAKELYSATVWPPLHPVLTGLVLAVGGVDGVWTSRMVDFQAVAAGARISRRLNVSPAEPVLRITRLRLADGDPMSVDTLHVPAVLVPGLTPQDLETGSFYQILGQRYGIGLATATQIIEPTVVDTAEAELLGVPVHTPALLFERATADTEGRVVEFTHSVYRGDRYRIVTQLSLAADDDGSGGRVLGGSWSTASAVPGADTLVLDSYWSG